jgi:nucleoside 2-deoxyribosyltransferase
VNIYLICPVRNVSKKFKEGLEAQVKFLEAEGHTVYYPARDTNQDDPIGLRICRDNRKAIEEADVIYIAWDGKSKGSLLDLGMAFALRKPLRIITEYMPPKTPSKSIQNMMYAWEEEGAALS